MEALSQTPHKLSNILECSYISICYFPSAVLCENLKHDRWPLASIHKVGSNISTFWLNYAPTVTYFGSDHLPYATLPLVPFKTVSHSTGTFFMLLLIPFKVAGTESETFDCRWFSAIMLLNWKLSLIALATTLLVIILYTTIIFVVLLMARFNSQSFKKVTAHHLSTDLTLLILVRLFYTATIIGNDPGTLITMVLLASALVPLVYIAFFIGYWRVS